MVPKSLVALALIGSVYAGTDVAVSQPYQRSPRPYAAPNLPGYEAEKDKPIALESFLFMDFKEVADLPKHDLSQYPSDRILHYHTRPGSDAKVNGREDHFLESQVHYHLGKTADGSRVHVLIDHKHLEPKMYTVFFIEGGKEALVVSSPGYFDKAHLRQKIMIHANQMMNSGFSR